LAIYAVPDTPQDLVRYYNTLDSTERKKADTHFKVLSGDVQKQMEKFRQEVKTGKVVELHGAHHYVFLSHPAEVEQAMRQFLLSVTE
jgi:pimeloyl-ACP methyl ester carboxylesterase